MVARAVENFIPKKNKKIDRQANKQFVGLLKKMCYKY
jgi:hypothetical protein